MFQSLIKRDIRETFDLRDEETVLFVGRRHVTLLSKRLILPVIVLLLCIGVVIFRAIGGEFVEPDAATFEQFMLVDGILTALTVITFVLLIFAADWLPGGTVTRIGLAVLAIALLVWLFFRSQGGRVLSVESSANVPFFDLINIILLLVALGAILVIVHTWYDWSADQIILTSQRVIYNRDTPLVRHMQEQLPLNDVEQVDAMTTNYLEHWLNFGAVRIQSASFHHALIFPDAHNPHTIQARIMDEVNRIRRQEEETDNIGQLVETHVYQKPPEEPDQVSEVQHSYTPYMLHWLFPENPQYDKEEDRYTWHPHWFFLVQDAFLPFLALLLALGGIIMVATLNLLSATVLLPVAILVLAIFSGRVWWTIEDHYNDRYILSTTEVVDVDKKPFGPEDSSASNLDALQNITYKTSFLGRIVGYGNVFIETAGSAEGLTFHNVPNPREVVAMIDEYQARFNRRQEENNLEDTLAVLRYYHATHQEPASDDDILTGLLETPPPEAGNAA